MSDQADVSHETKGQEGIYKREMSKGECEKRTYFSCTVFIKIASVKVTGSFMSAWWVPALVCVAGQ